MRNQLLNIRNYRLTAVLVLMIFSCTTTFSQKLIWSDEFNGSTIDTNKWESPEFIRKNNPNGPEGWWLKEDSYLDGKGNLVIRAKKIANRNNDTDEFDYSTGALRTRGKFEPTFGRFEARCKLPTQVGWWVAFWMYSPQVGKVNQSGEDGTEIDIMEGFGFKDHIQHALHYDGYGKDHKATEHRWNEPGIREGYHTYTLDWYENIYIFYVDGKETWRTDFGGVSKVPTYIKLTAELTTLNPSDGWAGDPAKGTFPDYFYVDYVRVYELPSTTYVP
jgi:beta-glucanase (GH16 family)